MLFCFISLVHGLWIYVCPAEPYDERRAFAKFALHVHGALVQLHERLHQREPYARARCLVLAVLLVVPVEYVRQGLLGDSVSVVCHADVHVRAICRERKAYLPASGSVLECV